VFVCVKLGKGRRWLLKYRDNHLNLSDTLPQWVTRFKCRWLSSLAWPWFRWEKMFSLFILPDIWISCLLWGDQHEILEKEKSWLRRLLSSDGKYGTCQYEDEWLQTSCWCRSFIFNRGSLLCSNIVKFSLKKCYCSFRRVSSRKSLSLLWLCCVMVLSRASIRCVTGMKRLDGGKIPHSFCRIQLIVKGSKEVLSVHFCLSVPLNWGRLPPVPGDSC